MPFLEESKKPALFPLLRLCFDESGGAGGHRGLPN